jgi:hypothetical protein
MAWHFHGRPRAHPSRRPIVDGELVSAQAQLDDDGSPVVSEAPERSLIAACGPLNVFSIRDSSAEPRRDERELGGEG